MFGYISKKAHEAAMAEKDRLLAVERENNNKAGRLLAAVRAKRAKSNGNLIPGGAKGKARNKGGVA